MGAFAENVEQVLAFIDAHAEEPAHDGLDEPFERLALATFAAQYAANPAYRAWCDRRRVTPGSVVDWRSIPAVPTSAFKVLDLACAPPEKIFLTSGTTRGADRRGRHLVPCLELYRRSALAAFRRAVLPDHMRPAFVALLAPPALLPASSLVQMVDWLIHEVGEGDGEYLLGERGFDPGFAAERISARARAGRPLCLIGLRVLFTQLFAHCRTTKLNLELPADSRVVDTGGSKGGRALSDGGFHAACWQTLGVPGYYWINEYGMTELCSQFYDDVLLERFAGSNAPRRKIGPAWTRTIAVDPATLEPLPSGARGILRHLDLANAGSVIAVQTEDLGVTHPGGGFELLGRASGAEPRGCALALAELLEGRGP